MKLLESMCVALAATSLSTVLAGSGIAQVPSDYTVVASGLNAPRGLRFGPNGDLYVAEAGTGGAVSTAGECEQVPGFPGPYTGGTTSDIVKIDSKGKVSVVAADFPSAQDAAGDLEGVADVAFLNGQLYALINGGGCSHGHIDSPNGIAVVDESTKKWKLIADLSAFTKTHPGRFINPVGFEPDGDWFKFIPVDGKFITANPNSGILASVSLDGTIEQLHDISRSQGKVTPTSIVEHNGDLYIGELKTFPIQRQWEEVLRLETKDKAPAGPVPGYEVNNPYFVAESKAGFTTVVAVDIGPDGHLYVLELADKAGFPATGYGKVVRVKNNGEIEDVITELNVPTGMTWGPDGDLYISDLSAVPAPHFGVGRILRFEVAPGS